MIRADKFLYYLQRAFRQFIPGVFYEYAMQGKLAAARKLELNDLLDRVHYYNKMDTFVHVGENATRLRELRILKSQGHIISIHMNIPGILKKIFGPTSFLAI